MYVFATGLLLRKPTKHDLRVYAVNAVHGRYISSSQNF